MRVALLAAARKAGLADSREAFERLYELIDLPVREDQSLQSASGTPLIRTNRAF